MKYPRPKIIFLTNMLSGGGAERSLLDIFKALDRRRFDPELWRLKPLNMYSKLLGASSATRVLPRLPQDSRTKARLKKYQARLPGYLRCTQSEDSLEDALRLFDALRPITQRKSPSLALVSSQINMNARVSIVQWLFNYQVPVVFIEQNEPYIKYNFTESGMKRDRAWAIISRTYPRASQVVAISAAARQSLISQFGINAKQVSSIPNPVNLKQLRTSIAARRPQHPFFNGRVPVLVCVARFHPVKNHAMLLRSFALVRKKTPARLILLGHGPLKESILRVVTEMQLSRDVAVIDFDPDPFPYLAHADLSVLASYSEGQGMAVVESLACGVPVACTHWKGVDELVQHGVNGIVCEINDQALAAGILAGLKLSKSKTAHSAARLSAERFDVSQIAPLYENLLVRTLGLLT